MIRLTEELQETWAAVRLEDPPATRALKLDFDWDSVVGLADTIPLQNVDTLKDDFVDIIGDLVEDDTPSVFVVRTAKASSSFILFCFVPDTAPVRQKMFIGSNRQELKGLLDASAFGADYHASEREELSATSILERLEPSSLRGTEHGAGGTAEGDGRGADEPEAVRLQREADLASAMESSSAGLSRAGASSSGATVGFGISEEALGAIRGLSEGNGVVRIDLDVGGESLTLGHASPGEVLSSADVLVGLLPPQCPCFFLLSGGAMVSEAVKAGPEPDKGAKPDTMMLYICPEDAPVRAKMMASSAKGALESHAKNAANLVFARRTEGRDPDDIAEALQQKITETTAGGGGGNDSVTATATEAPTFSKPKPKGRGRRKMIK